MKDSDATLVRLAIALALAKCKPAGLSTQAHIERVRQACAPAPKPSAPRYPSFSTPLNSQVSRSSETLVTSAHSFVSASTKPSEDPAALSSLKQRIRQLEESLERAESEADQAKIKLNAHILQNPPIPKAPIADKVQPLTKKTSTKRKPGTAGDQEPGNSNAPMKRRKKGGGAPAAPVLHPSPLSTSPPGTSLKRILEELGTDIRLPPVSSSLGTLAAVEELLETIQSTARSTSATPNHLHRTYLARHLSRALSSTSRLLFSALSLPRSFLPPNSRDLQDSSVDPEPPSPSESDIRLRIRAYGIVLRRLLDLSWNWDVMMSSTLSTLESTPTPASSSDPNLGLCASEDILTRKLTVQLAEDIVVPLLRSIEILSVRYTEKCLNTPNSSLPTARGAPSIPVIDLRAECVELLVRLTDHPSLRHHPATSTNPRRDTATLTRQNGLSKSSARDITRPEAPSISSSLPLPPSASQSQPSIRTPPNETGASNPLFVSSSTTTHVLQPVPPSEITPEALDSSSSTALGEVFQDEILNIGNIWLADIILYLASAELRRVVLHSESSAPGGETMDSCGPSGVQGRLGLELRTLTKTLAREESVWYLSSIIHSASQSLSLPPSIHPRSLKSDNDVDISWISQRTDIAKRARDMLMEVLITDRSSDEGERGSSLGDDERKTQVLGLLEREMVFGVVEAVNRCCGEVFQWEVEGEEAEP